MASTVLTVRVVSPQRTVWEGEARGLVAPAWDGSVGILPGHAPFITLLGAGRLEIDLPDGGSERFFVNRGALKVEGDEVMVLTEYADRNPPEDFDPRTAWLDEPELEEIAGPENPLV